MLPIEEALLNLPQTYLSIINLADNHPSEETATQNRINGPLLVKMPVTTRIHVLPCIRIEQYAVAYVERSTEVVIGRLRHK